MSYLALYRKYRSQNFDEVVGQEAIIKTLQSALTLNKISHAYLFSGPRGTGKTSVARLFAKALNCEEGLGKQCNKCSSCLDITASNFPDVVEIDAASNSGVDEVRNLIEKVKYAPIRGKYKVYIIDEIHMMTNNAFNALLKTLEEPPAHIVFILCTTEPHKLLPTILSRCQRFEFNKINEESLRKLLVNVLDKEKITYSSGALDLIIELANGGARDALSILDQVIAYSGVHFELKDIEDVFGLASMQDKIALLENIKNKNSAKVIKSFNDFTSKNIDVYRFVSELLTLLKDALILKMTGNKSLVSTSSIMSLEIAAKLFSNTELFKMIDLLIDCQKEFKTTSNPNFLVEIYLLKLINETTSSSTPVEKEEISEEIKIKEDSQKPVLAKFKVKEETKPEKEIIADLKPIIKEEKRERKTRSLPMFPITTVGESYNIDQKSLISLIVISKKEEKKELAAKWNQLNEFEVDDKLCAYALLLEDGVPYILSETILVLMYNIAKPASFINIKANQEILSDIIYKLTGRKLFICAINRKESTELVMQYRNLIEVKKLPRKEDIGLIEFK